jgi:hypothetical protein
MDLRPGYRSCKGTGVVAGVHPRMFATRLLPGNCGKECGGAVTACQTPVKTPQVNRELIAGLRRFDVWLSKSQAF